MLLFCVGGEAAAEGVFGKGAGVGELGEVVSAAGFFADAGEAEAAEGLALDECAGDAAVDVEVADEEVGAGAADVGGGAGEESAGEFAGGVVGEFEGVIEVCCVEDGEDGAEDFFGGDAGGCGDVGEEMRGDEIFDF